MELKGDHNLTTEPLPYAPPHTTTLEEIDVDRRVPRVVTVACRGLGVASLVFAILFACWAFSLSSGASVFAFAVLGLICSPYLMLWLACRSLSTWSGTILIALTLAGFVYLGIDAFRAVDNDAQGALNLLFTPIFQLGAGFATLCLAVALDWGERKLFSVLHAASDADG